jgi:hypothetical protein
VILILISYTDTDTDTTTTTDSSTITTTATTIFVLSPLGALPTSEFTLGDAAKASPLADYSTLFLG